MIYLKGHWKLLWEREEVWLLTIVIERSLQKPEIHSTPPYRNIHPSWLGTYSDAISNSVIINTTTLHLLWKLSFKNICYTTMVNIHDHFMRIILILGREKRNQWLRCLRIGNHSAVELVSGSLLSLNPSLFSTTNCFNNIIAQILKFHGQVLVNIGYRVVLLKSHVTWPKARNDLLRSVSIKCKGWDGAVLKCSVRR